MEALTWLAQHWFDLFQTVGIIGGLLFTAFTVREDGRGRQIANLIAIKQQYREIWTQLFERPTLFRVLKPDIDLKSHPISDEETLFVEMLFVHLDTVHRAKKAGLFIEIKGIQKDVRDFIKLPIPGAVWKQMRPFQDDDFVKFVESAGA